MHFPDRFETLVADLSELLCNDQLDLEPEVERVLEALTDVLATDRATFLELRPDDGGIVVTHSWARPRVRPAAKRTRVALGFPWYYSQLRAGRTLRFERLPEELPPDAEGERRYVQSLPMRAHLAVPLRMGGRWVCAILTEMAFESRVFTDAEIGRLQIVGQILANALHRRRIESELRESLAELRALQERLEAENAYLRESIDLDAGFEQIAGRSPALRSVLEQAAQVAPTVDGGADPGRDRHRQGARRARDPRAQPAPRAPVRRR